MLSWLHLAQYGLNQLTSPYGTTQKDMLWCLSDKTGLKPTLDYAPLQQYYVIFRKRKFHFALTFTFLEIKYTLTPLALLFSSYLPICKLWVDFESQADNQTASCHPSGESSNRHLTLKGDHMTILIFCLEKKTVNQSGQRYLYTSCWSTELLHLGSIKG